MCDTRMSNLDLERPVHLLKLLRAEALGKASAAGYKADIAARN
jgi:hypothetical protein